MKKLSIVMPYYNRRNLLLNTLRSIEYFQQDYSVEIIIVDDGSDESHRINDINELFPGLDINLIILKREKDGFRDCCIAYNTGFNVATGDIIVINCAEVMYHGNIIEYIFSFLKRGMYFNFACYSVNKDIVSKLSTINWKGDVVRQLEDAIGPRHPMPLPWKDCETGWYLHTEYRAALIPFCAAMMREDMEVLSGFDERFSGGIGYNDMDFSDRVSNLLKPTIIDAPFCIHQYHTPTVYEPIKTQLNRELWFSLKENFPDRIKADKNKIYLR